MGMVFTPNYQPQVEVNIEDFAPPSSYLIALTYADSAGNLHVVTKSVVADLLGADGVARTQYIFYIDTPMASIALGSLALISPMRVY